MNFDLSPRVAAAHVDLARPLGAHLLFREIGADAKGRAGTALALHAMTRAHKRRLAGRLRAQRAAAAMRDPGQLAITSGLWASLVADRCFVEKRRHQAIVRSGAKERQSGAAFQLTTLITRDGCAFGWRGDPVAVGLRHTDYALDVLWRRRRRFRARHDGAAGLPKVAGEAIVGREGLVRQTLRSGVLL